MNDLLQCFLYYYLKKEITNLFTAFHFVSQGTMEEKIYDRQVAKQSMSCRVVDEQQIDRHFTRSDISELYEFKPDEKKDRKTPALPKVIHPAQNTWSVTQIQKSIVHNKDAKKTVEK